MRSSVGAATVEIEAPLFVQPPVIVSIRVGLAGEGVNRVAQWFITYRLSDLRCTSDPQQLTSTTSRPYPWTSCDVSPPGAGFTDLKSERQA